MSSTATEIVLKTVITMIGLLYLPKWLKKKATNHLKFMKYCTFITETVHIPERAGSPGTGH